MSARERARSFSSSCAARFLRLDASTTAARDVLTISQNDPHALNLLSMLALRQEDNEAALAHQTLAVEVRPRDPDLVFNLALVHLARGENADAHASLTEALRLDPAHQRAAAKLREIGATISGAGRPGNSS